MFESQQYFILNKLERFKSVKRLERLYSKIKYNPLKLELRSRLLFDLLNNFGENSFVKEGVTIKHFKNISIGKNSSINQNCYLSGRGEIDIGNNVRMAHDCALHSTYHITNDTETIIANQGLGIQRIVIEDDVLIGCHTIITHGVHIGRGSVIGANSFVNKNVPPYSTAVGSPIKIVKNRKD